MTPEAYRAAQLVERRRLLAQVVSVVDSLNIAQLGDEWPQALRALRLLILDGSIRSASVALDYYVASRALAGAAGAFGPVPVAPTPIKLIDGTLTLAGPIGLKKNITAGTRAPAELKRLIASRISGVSVRISYGTGRRSLTAWTTADPEAVGWRRVTSSSPCDWCRRMARGIKPPEARFPAHVFCDCQPATVFASR